VRFVRKLLGLFIGAGAKQADDYAAALPKELRHTLDGIRELDDFWQVDWMVRFLNHRARIGSTRRCKAPLERAFRLCDYC
jgi:hypothetical protein